MPRTRSESKEDTAPTCHVLDYAYAEKDNDDGFSMTVLVHTLRFHITVESEDLKSKSVREEYLSFLNAVRSKEQPKKDTKKRKRGEDVSTVDSAYSSPEKRSASSTSSASVTLADDDREDPDGPIRELQNWILAPFGDIFASRAPSELDQRPKTVAEWFHGAVFYYTLTCASDSCTLTPTERHSPSASLQAHIASLVPSLSLPKYLLSQHLPIVGASSLAIRETSDSPSPRHPAVVEHTKTHATHFLKLVDPAQPGPVKRELKLLKQIEAAGLHEKLRVPLVQGVVVDDHDQAGEHAPTTSRDAPCAILGFLLTPIPGATPLTTMLDRDAATQEAREKWAREVKRCVQALHEEGITWGDAKADNFLVDGQGKLWIIDFGGSYTEGWVDAELAETREGDRAGMEKIVNAVRDPENFTFDPEDEDEGDGDGDEDEAEDGPATKVAKLQHGQA